MNRNELLAQLVAINSINPTLAHGAPGEFEITDFVKRVLNDYGIATYDVDTSQPNRPSLLAHIPCLNKTTPRQSLLLYAHTDTVGVDDMTDPLIPKIYNNRMYGRGAYDMKSGLACIMSTAMAFAKTPCENELWLMIVSDEEAGSSGCEAALKKLNQLSVGAKPTAAIVTEPSDLKMMLGHRGFCIGNITTYGKAAHTARRDQGIDAIAMAAHIICAVETLDKAFNAMPPHPLVGHRAIVVSLINGGSELFTYPAQCKLQFVRRTLPGETRSNVENEIELIFATLKEHNPQFKATFSIELWRDALETSPKSDIAHTLTSAYKSVMGQDPQFCGAPWWTDAALIQAEGIPTIIFGAAGGGIHATNEWVDLESVEQVYRILYKTAVAL